MSQHDRWLWYSITSGNILTLPYVTTQQVAMMCLCCMFSVLMLTLGVTSLVSRWMFLFWVGLLFLAFSGSFSLMPTATARSFGQTHVAMNYGLVFTSQVGGIVSYRDADFPLFSALFHLSLSELSLFVFIFCETARTRRFSVGVTRGVMVSMSAFLACHQCYCAGSSLAWGLNLRAVVCGIFWSSSPVVFSGYSGFLRSFIGLMIQLTK